MDGGHGQAIYTRYYRVRTEEAACFRIVAPRSALALLRARDTCQPLLFLRQPRSFTMYNRRGEVMYFVDPRWAKVTPAVPGCHETPHIPVAEGHSSSLLQCLRTAHSLHHASALYDGHVSPERDLCSSASPPPPLSIGSRLLAMLHDQPILCHLPVISVSDPLLQEPALSWPRVHMAPSSQPCLGPT